MFAKIVKSHNINVDNLITKIIMAKLELEKTENTAQVNFVKEVAKYFMNFLETDFKKRKIPKRNTIQKTRDGSLVGFNIEKYPKLKKELLNILNKKFNKESLNIPKKKYMSGIPTWHLQLINKKIEDLSEDHLHDAFSEIADDLRKKIGSFSGEYEKFLEESKEKTCEIFKEKFILPFLNKVDKLLENSNLTDENSASQSEIDLSDFLFSMFDDRYTEEILQSFFHKPEGFDFSDAWKRVVSLPEIKDRLLHFFENLNVGDVFFDLKEIERSKQHIDKTEIYLYFYEIAINNEKFPIIYLPVTIERNRERDQFTLIFDKRIFVNTKAIDFVAQEFNRHQQRNGTLTGQIVRIIYITDEHDFVFKIESIIKKIEDFFDLKSHIDIWDPKLQKRDNDIVSLSNKCFCFLFDKSDESLINDYEEILNNKDGLLENFASLLNGFIEDNPKPFMEEVENDWQQKSTPQKLTIESPIPLNDEQKQILMVMQKKDCKFLIIEGPPGTGKSHTITSIVCRALLEEKSVLILSDKKEALDVVEEKISQTLNKVRHEDNFQNPILRLGRSGNKFYQLVKTDTISKIRKHYRVSKGRSDERAKKKDNTLEIMKNSLEKNISFFKNIDDDIIFYCNNIGIETNVSAYDKKIIRSLDNYFGKDDYAIDVLQTDICRVFSVIQDTQKLLFSKNLTLNQLYMFSFSEEKSTPQKAIQALENYVNKLESIRDSQTDYLLEEKSISELTQKLQKIYTHLKLEIPETNLQLFRHVYDVYLFVFSEVDVVNFWVVIKNLPQENFIEFKEINNAAARVLKNENLQRYISMRHTEKKLYNSFKNEPEDSFFTQIHEIEELVTLEMTHFLDKRILEYVDNFQSDAGTLKSIIAQKQKFPQGLFHNLKMAFPCILAGIRDYAEFIPLRKDLFDLIIIDEASQVSIAQALPALIRGKQIIVLGDDKQFSNVKANNASTVMNQEYKIRVREVFAKEKEEDEFGWHHKIQENFDIKNSILKFIRFIRNYECQLKKHFRCYPEIISYSDKFFYDGSLQCMKIRGKVIEDVIKFDLIDHDGKLDQTKNTNELEANFIIKKLQEFKEKNIENSIGIITPHREQVAMLWDKINDIPERDWLFEQCKLKIMTFDTCQGEEKDYIFYSMVATREKDRLMYIFIKNLSSVSDEENGSIKAQRLNVGFSRAKECVHFVLSKPIEEFHGELKNALLHYRGELENGEKKNIGKTDPRSEMETQIQHYFYETKFYKENRKDIEFIPQFELGKYLRQLNKDYHHPNYKVDFLLIFKDSSDFGNQKIVIEYDGFKEHFENRDEVNETNYSSNMKEEDIYRQKILEGYGYRFLRINRFNIGKDPIQTLDDRLQNLVKKNGNRNH